MIPRDSMTYGEGTTVGPYEIRQHLGSGGMGDVYRASDSRLSRDVAIKIVSRLDPSHAARFDAEVRAVAGLTHPHIVSIFDVGEIDGRPYAVMEMLDGETLRARIDRMGARSENEVVAFGVQIASALEAAHARQIVHRDVKPENIFVLGSGTVKLVDFGLAAVMRPDDIAATRLTAQGLVVGTVGYLAPEQARGATIDARADVFSCGAVLFEMATGRRAFPGSSAVEILTAIVSGARPSFGGAPVSQWRQ
jgi:serine/threonine protein kinase